MHILNKNGLSYVIIFTHSNVLCHLVESRDMRLDESWTGRIWDHHTTTSDVANLYMDYIADLRTS